jgi:hypothetical protein
VSNSLSLVSPGRVAYAPQQAQIAQRLVLYRGELYRVPACYHLLRVKSGMAYVTQAGKDRFLVGGQEMQLDAATDVALVSAMQCDPAVLELFNA